LSLHNLKTAPGAKKRKRRVGRGNASGKGNYSGKGMKGQKARAGGSRGLKRRGIKGYLQRIPKSKGFKSLTAKFEEVNLSDLEKRFASGDEITPRILFKKDLIKSIKKVKILGEGKLSKKLLVKANAFTKSAKEAIIKAGGTAEVYKKEVFKKGEKKRR